MIALERRKQSVADTCAPRSPPRIVDVSNFEIRARRRKKEGFYAGEGLRQEAAETGRRLEGEVGSASSGHCDVMIPSAGNGRMALLLGHRTGYLQGHALSV